jgi:S1-C subfamily serine protease
LILTAAHVVKDGETVTLIRSDGSELKAVTVWRAPAEDVAILRITDGTMPEARMSCALPKPGEPIEIVGNPGPLTFITLRGFVASSVNVRGPWRVAHILDATAMGGVSGGGVFDTRGRLIGILVGAYASGISPQSGISVMVPASEICLMMGRT